MAQLTTTNATFVDVRPSAARR